MNKNLKASITENFRNTELGFLRIKRNLQIGSYSNLETENYLRDIISSTPLECIETRGKNHYFECTKFNAILTVNSHSLTIITAQNQCLKMRRRPQRGVKCLAIGNLRS